MKFVYKLRGLHCPTCASRIECDLSKTPGIEHVSLDLMGQTLSVEVDDASDPSHVYDQVCGVVHRYEPEVGVSPSAVGSLGDGTGGGDVSPSGPEVEEDEEDAVDLRWLIIGGILAVSSMILHGVQLVPFYVSLLLLFVSYVWLGWKVLLTAVRNLFRGRLFDEQFLMSLATVGAMAIGEYPEAVAVMLLYQIGEYFQGRAVGSSRRAISAMLDIRPDSVDVWRGGRLETVHPETVSVGEKIAVKPGARIALDGRVIEGSSRLDMRALTGESVPVHVSPGSVALSGAVNTSNALTLEVTHPYSDSTATKIVELMRGAGARKAKAEQFITTFARVYTPIVVTLAAVLCVIPPLTGLGSWEMWLHRALVFLVISCPCAVVISVPLTFFGGIGAASRRGILVRGANSLEALNHVTTFVFDKTGTLTRGCFEVTEIRPAPGASWEEVLTLAARAEVLSTHPIAVSLVEAAKSRLHLAHLDPATPYEELPGRGIRTQIARPDAPEPQTLLVGNARLMEEHQIEYAPCTEPGTHVYVALQGRCLGSIVISDVIRPDSAEALSELHALGVRQCVMLSGDSSAIAQNVASQTGMDAVFAELMPEDKLTHLETILQHCLPGEKVAFVGDGINDAPSLARADVGIAMGGVGSDAAIQAADIVLMTDEPSRLPQALLVARKTRRIVIQNIAFALCVKAGLLILGALGMIGLWVAVFGDVGVMLLAVLNATRMIWQTHER